MSRVASRFLVVLMATLMATSWITIRPAPAFVISQLYGGGSNAGATYTHDYVELFNRGNAMQSLAGWSVQYASATGTGTFAQNSPVALSGSIPPGGYFLVRLAGGAVGSPLPTPDISATAPNMSGTSGKVIVANVATGLACNGGSTPCDSSQLAQIVDLVGYGATNFFEGSGPAPALSNTTSAFRGSSGCTDTDNNSSDFTAATPAARNSATPLSPCGGGITLSIDNVSHNESTGSQLYDFTVSLSGAPGPGGVTFDISTADNSATTADNDYVGQTLVAQTITAPNTTYVFSVTVNGDTAFEDDETFFVNVTNVTGATLVDGQGVGTLVNDDPDTCGDPATLIHDIQGSGTSAAQTGVRTIEGVVVGDYQGTGQFGGYFVQEEADDFDADVLTSEGIFVFNTSTPVGIGDLVRVRGTAGEFSGMTQLSTVTTTLTCSTGNPFFSSSVTLPVAALADWERYEGMHVTIGQELTVTEVFTLGRFGEVALSVGGRLENPTNDVDPGAAAIALQNLNDRSRILLDDGNNLQNIDPTFYPAGGLSASNTLRVGDSMTSLSGVLEFRFNVYRVQPVDTSSIVFNHTNARPASPTPVGGDLQVAAFNVLNYFNGNGTGLDGAAGGFPTARGATNLFEFNRQRDKIISAITQLDAAVVGLMELENDATAGAEVGAIEDLVAGLNTSAGADDWAFIDTGVVGTDAIRVGIIYQPAFVTPVGSHAIINSTVDPRFIDTLNRPSIAQSFASTSNGARFTVVVNHLKS
jgi:predicted extracellular nuclease